jgi:hypothetical protein
VDDERLQRAQRIAADVLAAVPRPIVVYGLAYVRWACCDSPAHARGWAVEEARVAARMWDAMIEAEVIDAAWRDAAARRFGCPVCFRHARHDRRIGVAPADRHRHAGMDCPVCAGNDLAAPPTCGGVVAIAAAADDVLAAETHARALARALVPWGAREPAAITWRIRESARPFAPVPLRLAAAAASVATRPAGGPPLSIAGAADRRAAWRRAVAADAHVAPHPRGRGRPWPDGAAFAALPDPFVPLAALGALGCALEDLTEREAVLALPPAPLAGERFAELVVLEDRHGRRPAG